MAGQGVAAPSPAGVEIQQRLHRHQEESDVKRMPSRQLRRKPPPAKPASTLPPQNGDMLLHGAKAIAKALNLTERTVYFWLYTRRIKSAFKVGETWAVGRNALFREFHLDLD
jgi:hypothetical protein